MELPRMNEEGTVVGFTTAKDGIMYPNSTLKSAYLMVTPKDNCLSQSDDSFCVANVYNDVSACHLNSGTAFALHYRGKIVLVSIYILNISLKFEIFHANNCNIGWNGYNGIELLFRTTQCDLFAYSELCSMD